MGPRLLNSSYLRTTVELYVGVWSDGAQWRQLDMANGDAKCSLAQSRAKVALSSSRRRAVHFPRCRRLKKEGSEGTWRGIVTLSNNQITNLTPPAAAAD